MKPLSSYDAFQLFGRWTQDSLVSINFGRYNAGVDFHLRRAKLEVEKSSLMLEVKGSSMVQEVSFTEVTSEDVKREYSELGPVNPSFKACVGAKFANGDFCLIAQEN
jgi:hypothetical protein